MNSAIKKKGWVTPRLMDKIPQQMMLDNPELLPQQYWDDWTDRRDGMRGYNDHTKIQSEYSYFAEWFQVKRWNKKLKRLNKIRKIRRLMFYI